MRRVCKTASFAVAVFLLAGLAPARAVILTSISAKVTPQSGGVYLYTYTVTDLATSTANIGEFDLALTLNPTSGINTAVGAPLASITMPTGFINTYTIGDPSIMFQSTDPSTDLTPGTSATFSFTSTGSTQVVPYLFTSFDTGATAGGFVIGPATVPEPSSWLLGGLGMLTVAGWKARGRSRNRDAAV